MNRFGRDETLALIVIYATLESSRGRSEADILSVSKGQICWILYRSIIPIS